MTEMELHRHNHELSDRDAILDEQDLTSSPMYMHVYNHEQYSPHKIHAIMEGVDPVVTSKPSQSPHSNIEDNGTEGLQGRHAFCMLGRTLNNQSRKALLHACLYTFASRSNYNANTHDLDHIICHPIHVHVRNTPNYIQSNYKKIQMLLVNFSCLYFNFNSLNRLRSV